jgi:dipeptidyl aminopeptidase/acylaminoacyl peptidase
MAMMRSLIVAVTCVVVCSSTGAGTASPRVVERHVLIPSDEGRVLAGTLTLPADGGARFPVALTLTGSGAHFRDGNRSSSDAYRPFEQIAAALATRGVATLRLDDRGVGQSTGSADSTTGDDVARDALVAIAWLRRQPSIDAERIAVIGHSFGGAVAPLVAGRDPRVAAVVLMGAPARSFREIMRYQHRYRIEHDPRIAPPSRDSALAAAMRVQERNATTSGEHWRRWLQHYDPLPAARRVACPVLILQGLTDRAVPPEDATALADAMRSSGNARVTLRVFANLNHHFQRDSVGAREGYARLPTQDLAPEFLATVSDWLAHTLAR